MKKKSCNFFQKPTSLRVHALYLHIEWYACKASILNIYKNDINIEILPWIPPFHTVLMQVRPETMLWRTVNVSLNRYWTPSLSVKRGRSLWLSLTGKEIMISPTSLDMIPNEWNLTSGSFCPKEIVIQNWNQICYSQKLYVLKAVLCHLQKNIWLVFFCSRIDAYGYSAWSIWHNLVMKKLTI